MIYIEEINDNIDQPTQSSIARKLLLRGLKNEFGIKEMPKWEYSEFGKPYFRDHPNLHFNLSHCNRAVVCAIDKNPIGIDVEIIHKFDEELARYISTYKEFETIIKSPDPSLSFTILWTKKESFMKLTGKGLSTRQEIQDCLFNNSSRFFTSVNETGGYVITSCQYVR